MSYILQTSKIIGTWSLTFEHSLLWWMYNAVEHYPNNSKHLARDWLTHILSYWFDSSRIQNLWVWIPRSSKTEARRSSHSAMALLGFSVWTLQMQHTTRCRQTLYARGTQTGSSWSSLGHCSLYTYLAALVLLGVQDCLAGRGCHSVLSVRVNLACRGFPLPLQNKILAILAEGGTLTHYRQQGCIQGRPLSWLWVNFVTVVCPICIQGLPPRRLELQTRGKRLR